MAYKYHKSLDLDQNVEIWAGFLDEKKSDKNSLVHLEIICLEFKVFEFE